VISLPDHPVDLEEERQSDSLLSFDTRNASSKSSYFFKERDGSRRKVVVDVREFRSTLPCMLHSHRLAVIPRTLQVGDYVLSPEICVERKGISDLFQSFASGRLYNQVEAMGRHYKYPCLLIEFNVEKPFALVVRRRKALW
jgi:DNA excision repair protein ERCC-4